MSRQRTLLDKVWDAHVIVGRDDGASLLAVDRHYVHEGSFHGFAMLEHAGRKPRRPDLTFGIADHYVPSHARTQPIADAELAGMIAQLRANTQRTGIANIDIDDPRQGIVHVAMPEQGLTLPGLSIVCGDSHTSTHGAFGALAFGIGASEVSHVLATQTLWQRRPRVLRVTLDGALGRGVAAKDVILALIAQIGTAGAVGHVIEFAGSMIRAATMEARMTICNMSIEAGARAGMVAPDDTTFAWLAGRARVPSNFDAAVVAWRGLASDEGAGFDREASLDVAAVAPMVTWGTSPESALPVTGLVPEPVGDGAQRQRIAAQLEYMGLTAGAKLEGLRIDRVFIGSCTNARLPDLRQAADVLRGRRAAVPGLAVAGSMQVKRDAEAEGLHHVFEAAGLRWGEPGCSMCVGTNGDLVAPGERCAATTNRNFQGRQGPAARTHLMSPAMAAAAALRGCITDVRTLER
jgi:3-isopropylmalate/(R)-2-methylmalate dehydratase large subunit